jgi:hypothetical protein
MGFGLTGFLFFMHRRFVWWPLYPVGYAIGYSWAQGYMWFSILLSWVAKRSIVEYGGLRLYRKAMNFFFGLILGQFFMGSMWALIGVILGRNMYTLFP